jgi:FkbM family methyltransferase
MLLSSNKKVIYDFGANNGDDVDYYLKKSDLVVAVEANPLLAGEIRLRFSDAIAASRLIVESCILSAGEGQSKQSFYIHKNNHVVSQFPRPEENRIAEFEEIFLPSRNVVDVIKEHGSPYYVKIDIEHYDKNILEALFSNKIRPPFVSAESHSIEVFSILVSRGKYDCFNLVDGASVCKLYEKITIKTVSGEEKHSFPYHSAGPFGEDINGDWMTANNFFMHLAFEGLGWKDIHATTEFTADPGIRPKIHQMLLKKTKRKIQHSRAFNALCR